MSKKIVVQGQIGLCGGLFLLFVYLKLTNAIDWAWYWVVSPLWLPAVAVLGAFIAFVAIAFPVAMLLDWRSGRKAARRREQREQSRSRK